MDRNSEEFQDYLRVKVQLLNHFEDLKVKSPSAQCTAQMTSDKQCRENVPVEQAAFTNS